MSEQGNIEVDDQHRNAKLSIAKELYTKSAILRTCYWLERDLWFQIDEVADRWVVNIGLRLAIPTLDQPNGKKIEAYFPDFFSTLQDSQLRVEIQTETASIRELILAKAFSEAGVLEDDPPGTIEDPVATLAKTENHLVTISTNISGLGGCGEVV
jgi:His-Xaa-Ser system protein HxsD